MTTCTTNSCSSAVESIQRQITALQRQTEALQKELPLIHEISEHHSAKFIECVGLDTLKRIPVVDPEVVGFKGNSKYPVSIPPSKLGSEVIVRGHHLGRGFVAAKVRILDQTGLKVTEVVQIVFMRCARDCGVVGYREGNYVTALGCVDDEGQRYSDGLYQSGDMTGSQLERASKLFRGEKIPHGFDKRRFDMQIPQ